MIEAYQAQAERLTDLVLEQLERLAGSEHEEAYILTLVARDLACRVGELGEVIESEARDLGDNSALQMATALQAQCTSLLKILGQIAVDPRFGLLPGSDLARPTPRWRPKPPNGRLAGGQDDGGRSPARSGEAAERVEQAADQAQQQEDEPA
jgi:hypothetical protein